MLPAKVTYAANTIKQTNGKQLMAKYTEKEYKRRTEEAADILKNQIGYRLAGQDDVKVQSLGTTFMENANKLVSEHRYYRDLIENNPLVSENSLKKVASQFLTPINGC